jgi:hypothetical protein
MREERKKRLTVIVYDGVNARTHNLLIRRINTQWSRTRLAEECSLRMMTLDE